MGMRRRTRRRGLLAGAVAGGAIAHHRNKQQRTNRNLLTPARGSMCHRQQIQRTRSSTLRNSTPRAH